MKLVIVGGSAAGMAAAAKAKRSGADEVVVFEKSRFVSYAPCGIPYYFEGLVKSIDELVYYTAEFFREKRRIDVRTEHVVREIDTSSKKVHALDKHGNEVVEEYDKLVLATGGEAVKPGIEGIELEGIHTIRTLEDGESLYMDARNAHNIAIVGGGYVGIEMAEAFIKMGKRIHLFEMMPHIMPAMDDEVVVPVEEEMRKAGINLHLGEKVEAFDGDGRVKKVITQNDSYEIDAVLLSIGVKPNVDFARRIGLKLGKYGIDVNEYMQTSMEDIYAAGDNVEVYNLITKKKDYIPLAPAANKMGRIAGENAAAGNRKTFPGVVGTSITKFMDMHIGKTGLSLKQAMENGFDAVAVDIQHGTRSHYYPGGKKINIRLVADRDSHAILGGQITGEEGVVGRINTLAAAITKGMKVEELSMLDMAYAPPFAPVWDGLIVAANVIQKKLA